MSPKKKPGNSSSVPQNKSVPGLGRLAETLRKKSSPPLLLPLLFA